MVLDTGDKTDLTWFLQRLLFERREAIVRLLPILYTGEINDRN